MTTAEKLTDWLNNRAEKVKTKEGFEEGAILLLGLSKNRFQYNFMMRSWQMSSTQQTLFYELHKHLNILMSGITLREIEVMKPKVDAIEKEIEIKPSEPQYKGKRADHDQLPSEIQIIYVEVDNLRMKMRSLHEQLKAMGEKALPCDRHEAVTMLIGLDERYHELWDKYDHYDITSQPKEEKKEVNDSTISTVSSCRSFISKNLPKLEKLKGDNLRLSDFEALRKTIYQRYQIAVGMGANFSAAYVERLKNVGVLADLK